MASRSAYHQEKTCEGSGSRVCNLQLYIGRRWKIEVVLHVVYKFFSTYCPTVFRVLWHLFALLFCKRNKIPTETSFTVRIFFRGPCIHKAIKQYQDLYTPLPGWRPPNCLQVKQHPHFSPLATGNILALLPSFRGRLGTKNVVFSGFLRSLFYLTTARLQRILVLNSFKNQKK